MGILTKKILEKISNQNSIMSEYEYIPDPRKIRIGSTGKTRLFDECRVFLSGMSVGY